MTRSEFIDGLEYVLYNSAVCDGHDIEQVMKYIETNMVPNGKETGQTVHPLDVYYIMEYKWEPEND